MVGNDTWDDMACIYIADIQSAAKDAFGQEERDLRSFCGMLDYAVTALHQRFVSAVC